MLDSRIKSGLGSRRGPASGSDRGHRLHRRSPRAVGAACGRPRRRRRGLFAGSREGRRRRARRRAGLRLGRADGRRPGHRRRAHLYAEPPAPPAGRGGTGSGQARDLREAAGPGRRGRAAPRGRRGRRGRPGGCAVRVPVLPDGARGARRVRSGRDRRLAPGPRQLPAGLAPPRRRRQLACRRPAGRSIARVRRHRLALVRPRRVRLRPSHQPALGANAHRGPGAPHRGGTPGVRVRRRAVASRARSRTEDAAIVQFETDGRRAGLGGGEPGVGRAQEPALDRARRRGGGARLRP